MLLALLLLDLLPPLYDAERFRVTRFQINEILLLNRQFASRLVDVHRLTNQGDHQAMRETDRLYAAWDFLRDGLPGDRQMVKRSDILKAEELFAKKQLREECVFWAAITVAMSALIGVLWFLWG